MTRLGFEVDEAEKVIEFCKKNNLNLVGIFHIYLIQMEIQWKLKFLH